MTHAILFGELSGREIAEFLKSTLAHDGTVRVRPTPTEAELVVYQMSLADPSFEITVEAMADGVPSKHYDGARTEVRIDGSGRGIRALATRLAEEYGGLVQTYEQWTAVPGARPGRLSPKAKLCLAVFNLFGVPSGFPSAARDHAGLAALKEAIEAYLAAPPSGG
ncbi:hypothetical protein [Azospirillum sp.]|uniref:hypothetical protein n=1 Tax=Azospirillum sp. TaxID=34012 RepID=UPI002D4391FC|nr:hypothetical protein [Azospirillum sp.]HYD66213.1 hypothetical protein [Azospirillum sp.]